MSVNMHLHAFALLYIVALLCIPRNYITKSEVRSFRDQLSAGV